MDTPMMDGKPLFLADREEEFDARVQAVVEGRATKNEEIDLECEAGLYETFKRLAPKKDKRK